MLLEHSLRFLQHLPFSEEARLNSYEYCTLYMDKWNRLTPVCRWLSLTQAKIEFPHSKPSDLILHVVPDVFMGHAIRMWSAVCSVVLQLQFDEEVRPHLCMVEWNCPTLVRRWLSLTQAVWGKLIPTDLALVLGVKTWRAWKYSHNTPHSIYDLSTQQVERTTMRIIDLDF